MCTFTQGLVDQGKRSGIMEEKKATIIRMLKLKKSLEEISVVANVPLSVVQKIEMQLTSNSEETLDKLNNF